MLTITSDTLEQVDDTFVQLLVDAGWIEVTREWWCCEVDGWSVRKRQQRRFRKHENRSWNFPCSNWSHCTSVPETGRKRNKKFVAHVYNDMGTDHVVEFRILNKAVMQ